MTTIDRLRHPSISAAVTRAAGIDPEPTPRRGVTRWTAQARRAVSPAARPTSWKSARGPGQRGRLLGPVLWPHARAAKAIRAVFG